MTYRIKPLVWRDGPEPDIQVADGFMARTYFVWRSERGWLWSDYRVVTAVKCLSLADGKAKAEAAYQEWLKQALEEVEERT